MRTNSDLRNRSTQTRRSRKPDAVSRVFAAVQRSDDANAFIADPGSGPARAFDDLAEMLAEEYMISVTSAEEVGEDVRDELVPEEMGGPFVVTTGAREFARTVDDTNPEDCECEPFPTVSSSPAE